MKITFDNGETYTKEQFQKDLIRMFDSLKDDEDKKGDLHCDVIACSDCPLNHYSCSKIDESLEKLDLIEQVHKWAKEHPIKTNRDKLKEVFNVNLDKDAELYLSYYAGQRIKFDLTTEDRWVNQPINKWLDSEYKDNKKDD